MHENYLHEHYFSKLVEKDFELHSLLLRMTNFYPEERCSIDEALKTINKIITSYSLNSQSGGN